MCVENAYQSGRSTVNRYIELHVLGSDRSEHCYTGNGLELYSSVASQMLDKYKSTHSTSMYTASEEHHAP